MSWRPGADLGKARASAHVDRRIDDLDEIGRGRPIGACRSGQGDEGSDKKARHVDIRRSANLPASLEHEVPPTRRHGKATAEIGWEKI